MAVAGWLRARWALLRSDRHRRRLLIAWAVVALWEILFRASDLAPVPMHTWIVELGALVGVALVHASLAPNDWRASAAWPGTLYAFAVVLRVGWEMVALAFDTVVPLVPFAGLGALALLSLLVAGLDRLWRKIPAVVLASVAPLLVQIALVPPKQSLAPFLPAPTMNASSAPMVLITVDTLRADAAQNMRVLQRLAQRGAYWPRATSASSWTWPAVVTLLSGTPAATHGSGRKPELHQRLQRWSDQLPWLPAELRSKGITTVAFTTNPMLTLMGLGASFDRYWHGNVVRVPLAIAGFPPPSSDGGDAEALVNAAIDWLQSAPPHGWFLWLHLYDPHLPYQRATATKWDYNLLRGARIGDWYMLPEVQRDVRQGYAEQVAHADVQLNRLLDTLEARGFFDDGTLIFSSDHGEELWDHGDFEHGHSHHGEVIDVPLVLVSPGVAPEVYRTVAALEDIPNTLRAIAGIEHGGLDLRAPIPERRVAWAHGNLYHRPMHSARVGNLRVIFDGERSLVYNLADDPNERSPMPLSEALRSSLDDASQTHRTALPPGDDEALRALGYVH